jgi:hypothetical protein
MPKEAESVWVSVVVPSRGADTYDGARVMASTTEDSCYKDLEYFLTEVLGAYVAGSSNQHVITTLNQQVHEGSLRLWKVEECFLNEDGE